MRHNSQSTTFAHNPYFGRADNGPYQLGHMFRQLPPHGQSVTTETALKLDAARQHAANGINTLTYGLEAVGSLMVSAGASGEGELDSTRMTELGDLIQYIAVELRFLRELEGSAEDRLQYGKEA